MKPIIRKIHSYFTIVLVFSSVILLNAQTTTIPDPIFEQSLINLGIDSDGVINGQVLTSDVNTIVALDLSQQGAEDITGIEDFTALEILNVNNKNLTTINLTNNIQLKELYISNTGGENLLITSLDLSNNINLEEVYSEDLFFLSYLNLKNGNNAILNVAFSCCDNGLINLDCVIVDDEVAANSDQPPYSLWFIDADFVYSEDCILTVAEKKEKLFSVFPNPAKDKISIASTNNGERLAIKIYSIHGQLLQSQNHLVDGSATIDISKYVNGVYFISVQNENEDFEVIRFIKK